MTPNPGRQPDETRGKRIAGRLNNGREFGRVVTSADLPSGWSADRCGWSNAGPGGIAEYEVVG